MNVRKWVAIGAAVLLTITIGVASLILTRSGNDVGQINVYFFNPAAMKMEAVARPLPEGDSQLQEVIRYLHSGPGTAALSTTWPVELAPLPDDLISAVKLEDSTLFAFLTPVFHEMTPLNQSLFKAAFIHTLIGLPSVSDITILVTEDYGHAFEMIMRDLYEDNESVINHDEDYTPYRPLIIYDISHAGVLFYPLDPPISPQNIVDHAFNHLHFVDATGTGLVVEAYLALNTNMQLERRARSALYLLIDGPRQEGTLSLVPPETRILRLDIDINNIDIYVNLSNDFVTRFQFSGNKELTNLMIHSIVNTLAGEVNEHARVHFLIEGQQFEQFHLVEDFHTAFMRDTTLLLSYIEAMAEIEAEAMDAYEYDEDEAE